jgi:hypothetical protein
MQYKKVQGSNDSSMEKPKITHNISVKAHCLSFMFQLCVTMASHLHTAQTQYRKFETNIPRKGIAQPQSQYPHSCICERLIYSLDQSINSDAG